MSKSLIHSSVRDREYIKPEAPKSSYTIASDDVDDLLLVFGDVGVTIHLIKI